MAKLGSVRLEEFFARGNAVKKIGDADGRSGGQTRRLYVDEFSTCKFEPRAFGFRFVACFKKQARDRSNRWQRFPAKTQRRNGKQIVSGFQFARGVALESQQRIVVNHAVTVVNDADHPLAADFRFDADGLRASVQRIFQKLFDNRSRPLDNFARSDFICNSFRQYPEFGSCQLLFRRVELDARHRKKRQKHASYPEDVALSRIQTLISKDDPAEWHHQNRKIAQNNRS